MRKHYSERKFGLRYLMIPILDITNNSFPNDNNNNNGAGENTDEVITKRSSTCPFCGWYAWDYLQK